MDERQLNFNQPLLSVRRGASMTAQSEVNHWKTLHSKPTLPPLPYYKSELKSGPIRNAGVVPFQWEQIPGRPKYENIVPNDNIRHLAAAPKLPPGRIANHKQKPIIKTQKDSSSYLEFSEMETKDKDGSSPEKNKVASMDARDPLSRTESFYNCSVSGVSGLDNPRTEFPGGFSDPQTRDFMMGRFLPAAKAVASETPNFVSRKHPSARVEVKPVKKVIKWKEQGPHCTWPGNIHGKDEDGDESDEEEEEEDEHDEIDNMSAKLCGLLPKFCILNPIPGMRDHGQAMSSVRSVRSRPANAESCRKSEKKQDRRNSHVGDMKRLPHQSSSKNEPPMNANSSRRSLTPLKGRSPPMLLDKEKRFLSLTQECRDLEITKLDLHNHVGTKFKEATSPQGAQEKTSPPNLAVEKTLYVDQEINEPTRNSISSSSDSRGRNPSVDSLQDIKSIAGWDEKQIYQPKSSDSFEKSSQDIWQILQRGKSDLKERTRESDLLALGPVLPKSPSESWLSRTLPSMSSKIPSSKSYLGNFSFRSSPVNAKCDKMLRSPNLQHTVFRPARELGPILEN